jgi:hypothetical protein
MVDLHESFCGCEMTSHLISSAPDDRWADAATCGAIRGSLIVAIAIVIVIRRIVMKLAEVRKVMRLEGG